MFYVIFQDGEELCISSKEFTTRKDAVDYACTVSPSRRPRVVRLDTEIVTAGHERIAMLLKSDGPTF